MAESQATPAPQSPRLVLATAVITMVGTVAVSFIGVVPQLRNNDRQELLDLKKTFEEFKTATTAHPVGTSGEKKQTISGTVRNDDGSRVLRGHDIYLLPEGSTFLTAKTDDAGRFTLQAVPRGTYSIIVRDSSNGQSGKGLLDDDDDEVRVIGARIRYTIQK
jgi:hypothetical protein